MPAPSLFAGATRAGVIKEIWCSHQSFGRQNRKTTVRDHMNSAANFNFRAPVKCHAGYCARVSTPLSTQSALKVRIHPFTHTLAHTPPPLAEWTMQHQHADTFRREEYWVTWGGQVGKNWIYKELKKKNGQALKNGNTPGPVIVLINHRDGRPLTHEDMCVWGGWITDVMRATDAGVFGTPMISFTSVSPGELDNLEPGRARLKRRKATDDESDDKRWKQKSWQKKSKGE